MKTHSSTFAWKIPRTVEPGVLQSIGSQRLRHDEHAPLILLYSWGEKKSKKLLMLSAFKS